MTIVMTKRNEKKKNKKKGVEKKRGSGATAQEPARRSIRIVPARRPAARRNPLGWSSPATAANYSYSALVCISLVFRLFLFVFFQLRPHLPTLPLLLMLLLLLLLLFDWFRDQKSVHSRVASIVDRVDGISAGNFFAFFFFYFCCCRCVAGVPTDKWGFRVRFQFSFRRRDAHPSAPSRVFFLYFLSIFYYTFTHDTPPLWNGTRLLKVDSVFCFPLLRFFFGSGRDVCGLPHKRHRSAKKLKKIGSPCNESFTITQKEMSKEIESKVACWCCHSITNRWFVVFFSKCLDNGFTLVIFQLDILPWIPWGTGFKNSTRNIVFALKDC